MKRKRIQKCDVFAPIDQTIEQKKVEYRPLEIASESSKTIGISRRQILATSGEN